MSKAATPVGQTAEEYASNLSPLLAVNAVPEQKNGEANSVPQVCKVDIVSLASFGSAAKCKSLDNPASTNYISLSTSTWAAAAAITISRAVQAADHVHGGRE